MENRKLSKNFCLEEVRSVVGWKEITETNIAVFCFRGYTLHQQ